MGRFSSRGGTIEGSIYDFALARYTDLGELDATFGTGGKVTVSFGGIRDAASSIAVQGDRKIVMAGTTTSVGGIGDFALVRCTEFGELDTSFGTNGRVITSIGSGFDFGHALALQSDGKLIVAGSSGSGSNTDFALARYTEAGLLDPSFGIGGMVITPMGTGGDTTSSVVVQSNGMIVVAGSSSSGGSTDFALARYTPAGALDTSFGFGGKVITPIGAGADRCTSMAIQSDGNIILAGYSHNGSNNDFALARYTPSGALDTTFGIGGKVTTPIGSGDDEGSGMVVQSDGKIVVGGYSGTFPDYDFATVRYTANGMLDTIFGSGGKVTTPFDSGNDQCRDLAVQSDGKIVLVGRSDSDFALVRYEGGSPGDNDSDGLRDTWELSYWPTIPEHKATDDFDGDGLTELEELAFGLNPTIPDASSQPQPVNEGGYLTMTISRQPGATYEVQSAGTLLGGQPDSFSPATTTVLLDNATTLKVRDNFLIGTTPGRYMRVKVTAVP